jgi:hypothetical protein
VCATAALPTINSLSHLSGPHCLPEGLTALAEIVIRNPFGVGNSMTVVQQVGYQRASACCDGGHHTRAAYPAA